MNRAHKQRGTTLIECVVAMAVLTVGSLGLLALHRNGVRIEADSRHVTRASAIAQDLVNQMESWTYDEAPTSRLSSVTTDNDTKLGDPAFEFETAAENARAHPHIFEIVDPDEAEREGSLVVFVGR